MPTTIQRVVVGVAAVFVLLLIVKTVAPSSSAGTNNAAPNAAPHAASQPQSDDLHFVPPVNLPPALADQLAQPHPTPPGPDATWNTALTVKGTESQRTQA